MSLRSPIQLGSPLVHPGNRGVPRVDRRGARHSGPPSRPCKLRRGCDRLPAGLRSTKICRLFCEIGYMESKAHLTGACAKAARQQGTERRSATQRALQGVWPQRRVPLERIASASSPSSHPHYRETTNEIEAPLLLTTTPHVLIHPVHSMTSSVFINVYLENTTNRRRYHTNCDACACIAW